MSYFAQVSLFDRFGSNKGQFSPMRDFKVCEPFRLVGTIFSDSTLDTNFWTSTVSGAGASNTAAAGLVTVASGTANNGFAQLNTVRLARFIFCHPHLWRGAIRIPTVVVALNTRRWGAFTTSSAPTTTDGVYFELSAAGALSVNSRNAGGTVNTVSSGSFNGDISSYTMDTNVHAYEIVHFAMGTWFYIDNVFIHKFTPTTANTSSTYSLPSNANSVNGAAGTTSGTIEVWAMSITRLGKDKTSSHYHNINTTAVTALILKRGGGWLHSVNFNTIPNTTIISIYDALSATNPIAIMNPPNSATPFSMNFQCPFYTGLTITTTPNAADTTVIYE